ncbi:hypothetical protein PG985_005745 [Apiospora marii]|uniref:uncharacterized protein n=1 Tax=Apiospora marii TaxID=335849 RepID=UPI00312E7FA1
MTDVVLPQGFRQPRYWPQRDGLPMTYRLSILHNAHVKKPTAFEFMIEFTVPYPSVESNKTSPLEWQHCVASKMWNRFSFCGLSRQVRSRLLPRYGSDTLSRAVSTVLQPWFQQLLEARDQQLAPTCIKHKDGRRFQPIDMTRLAARHIMNDAVGEREEKAVLPPPRGLHRRPNSHLGLRATRYRSLEDAAKALGVDVEATFVCKSNKRTGQLKPHRLIDVDAAATLVHEHLKTMILTNGCGTGKTVTGNPKYRPIVELTFAQLAINTFKELHGRFGAELEVYVLQA